MESFNNIATCTTHFNNIATCFTHRYRKASAEDGQQLQCTCVRRRVRKRVEEEEDVQAKAVRQGEAKFM